MAKIYLKTSDKIEIAANIFNPVGVAKGVVLFNSATAVPQKVYAGMAQFLADNDYVAITYDYRGIGEFKEATFERATMADWAKKDCQCLLDFVCKTYPYLPISVVGHSFGGQALGVLNNNEKISKIVFIGAQLGYFGYFPLKSWPRMLFLWLVLLPILILINGYFPSKKLGMGENLPKGVAWQWRNWCLNPNYLYKDIGALFEDRTKSLVAKALVFEITDDNFAPKKAIDQLMARYKKLKIQRITVNPSKYGVLEIGHFGFFKSQFEKTLWKKVLDFLDN